MRTRSRSGSSSNASSSVTVPRIRSATECLCASRKRDPRALCRPRLYLTSGIGSGLQLLGLQQGLSSCMQDDRIGYVIGVRHKVSVPGNDLRLGLGMDAIVRVRREVGVRRLEPGDLGLVVRYGHGQRPRRVVVRAHFGNSTTSIPFMPTQGPRTRAPAGAGTRRTGGTRRPAARPSGCTSRRAALARKRPSRSSPCGLGRRSGG